MNRFHIAVTTLVAAIALGFTLKTLGQHEVPIPAAGAPVEAAGTPYSADSARIAPAPPDTEPIPTF